MVRACRALLSRNGILLFAILAPAAAGLWAISQPLVERIVALPFRDMTAAVLPWAILAGAARNFRIHFGEQVFLLREQTRIPLLNDIADGVFTIVGGAIGLALGGLPGSVAGAAVGAILSLLITLVCGYAKHGFVMPLSHVARIGGATAAMMAVLAYLPKSPDVMSLLGLMCAGGGVYLLALAAVYPAETGEALGKLKRLRQA